MSPKCDQVFRALIIVLVWACFPLMAGCGPDEPAAETAVARPVKAMKVQAGRSAVSRRYPGKVRAVREVDLSFRVAGPLIELPVVEGQEVARGQVVARLDPRDFRIRRDKAQAAFQEARRQYHRYQALLAKKAVAQSAFDSMKARYDTAKGTYEEAEAALKDTWLRAPFDGMVAATYVENHQDVGAKAPVLNLQDISRLEVEVQIPEHDVVGMNGGKARELRVRLDAMPGGELPARVSEFSTKADPVSQTFTVKVLFDKPQGFLVLPGMTAELVVKGVPAQDGRRILVPMEAVFVDAGGKDRVWMIDTATMTAHRKKVSLDGLERGQAVIKGGLKPGETIAIAGVHHLREGMRVRIMESKTGSAAK